AGPEAAGRGLHAGQGVVLQVLDGVDGVIAEGPEDAAGVEQQGRQAEGSGGGGEAQQGAPVEGQAEPGLRPPGDPLHERIGGDQGQGGDAQPYGHRRQGQQDDQRDQAAGDDEGPGLFHRNLAGGDRPAGGAVDAGV